MTASAARDGGRAKPTAPDGGLVAKATDRRPAAGTVDDVRRARAYLLGVAEPAAPGLARLVDDVGPVEAAERVARGAVPDAVVTETEARRDRDVDADLRRAEHVGARLVIPEDQEWPGWQLLALTNAGTRGVAGMVSPLALWVRGTGRLDELVDRAATVVGARAASGYGDYIAADWCFTLASSGVTIVSGAAHGIDAAAHRGAIAAGAPTVAVLGCGVDVCYPASHDRLLRHIAAHGALLSEYPPGTRPARHRFLVRNRLLAALTNGTLVVEAGLRSGARNTANIATASGRPVLAVPGPVTSASSAGCLEMIRTGQADMATSAAEVREMVGDIGSDLAPQPQRTRRPTDRLDGDELQVHDALDPQCGKSVEQLAAESGLPARKVRAVLPALELDGYCRRRDDGWCAASPAGHGPGST